MGHTIKLAALGAVAFMVLDGVWLGVLMKNFYRDQLAPIVRLADGGIAPNWPAAFVVYALLGTGIALFVIPIAMIRVPGLFRSTSELWCWILYFAMIQTPFVFQSRYTIPVRMLLFALIALCIERLLKPPAPRAHPGEVIPPR